MLSLFFAGHVCTDVQDIVSSEEDASVVGNQLIFNPFGSLIQQQVHVAVTANHGASIFNSVLQDNGHVVVQLFC